MCQQIVTFCSGSAKPLLLAGSFILLLLALTTGYAGYTSNSLYYDVDPRLADNHSQLYYAQLIAACYLTLLTIFATVSAHFDQKHSIRALALLTSLNFLLAAAAILLVPGNEIVNSSAMSSRLEQAQALYDRTEKPPIEPKNNQTNKVANYVEIDHQHSIAMSNRAALPRPARTVGDTDQSGAGKDDQQLTKQEATKIWDTLQERGCCGLKNATQEWILESQLVLPKSCCSNPTELSSRNMFICDKIDLDHSRPCLDIIKSASLNLPILLALIALVNLFLATVSGISTYRTFHYSEASQNAYT